MNNYSRNVLITGAGGFIGSNLWRYLSSRQYDVIACTSTELIEKPSAKQVYILRLPNERLGEIIAHEQPDFILHCAGGSSVSNSMDIKNNDFTKNVILTESLLQFVAQYSSASKVILISSAAVYGNPAKLPIQESDQLHPISPYGFHKKIAELIGKKYHKLYNIPITILRPFSVFGPGLKKQIFWDIYQKVQYEEKIYLYGDGNETRDFIFIDDFCMAVQAIMEKSNFELNIFNVATGRETKIRTIAELMMQTIGIKKQLIFSNTPRLGDPIRWCADISKIKKLGIQNSFASIEQGIEKYINHFKRSN